MPHPTRWRSSANAATRRASFAASNASTCNALPVAGMDGTLQYRMRGGPATDNVQAKTGTLSHVYTLSGFVTNAAGERLVFSLLLNRYLRPTDDVGRHVRPSPQSDLDAIATMLAGSGLN